MRINARLDEAAARQLTELTTTTGQSVSQVVRAAIAAYHVQVRGARKGSGSKLLALAGTGDSGHTDTAANHTSLFAQYLDRKYPPVPPSGPAPARRRAAKPRTSTRA